MAPVNVHLCQNWRTQLTHARGRRQKAELLPHDRDVEEDESDAGDDDVEEAVQEEDVQARVDVRVSEALMKYLVILWND